MGEESVKTGMDTDYNVSKKKKVMGSEKKSPNLLYGLTEES